MFRSPTRAEIGEVRHYGVISGDLEALARSFGLCGRPHRRLHFVYEAGPCGFRGSIAT